MCACMLACLCVCMRACVCVFFAMSRLRLYVVCITGVLFYRQG